MAKYDPLRSELQRRGQARVTMRFEEIAHLVGGLPPSAVDHQAWWANEVDGPHVQAHAWMGAGYRVEAVDVEKELVVFVRRR